VTSHRAAVAVGCLPVEPAALDVFERTQPGQQRGPLAVHRRVARARARQQPHATRAGDRERWHQEVDAPANPESFGKEPVHDLFGRVQRPLVRAVRDARAPDQDAPVPGGEPDDGP